MVYIYAGNISPFSGGPYSSLEGMCNVLDKDKITLIIRDGNKHWSAYRNISVLRFLSESNSSSILHIQGFFGLYEALLFLYCFLMRIEVIFSPRGQLRDWAVKSGNHRIKHFYIFILRPFLSSATALYSSELEKSDSLSLTSKVTIIHNLLDLPCVRTDEKENLILFLGRVEESKGVLHLQEVFQELPEKYNNWSLQIVGDGSDISRVNEVFRKGRSEGQDKWDYFSRATVFVSPSSGENFGNSIVEAWHSGCLVICGKNTPWSSLEVENITTVEFGNTENLKSALINYLDNFNNVVYTPLSKYYSREDIKEKIRKIYNIL